MNELGTEVSKQMLLLLLGLAQAKSGPQSQSKKEWDKNLAGKVHYILMLSLNNHLMKKKVTYKSR